jgi:hypothetical protein
MSALIVTTDVALARVAAIQAIHVLNINDLANALKSALVPGEPVTVKLIRHGEQATQAVGYLGDGTMIVAEDGAGHIGETVTMTVTSSLQTSAGRLIFARIGTEAPDPASAVPVPPQPADSHEPEAAPPADGAAEPAVPRSPFPPKQPRTLRTGTPRNPRR